MEKKVMDLVIRETQDGDRLIMAPAGRLDTATAGALDAAMAARIDAGARLLLLDLAAVDYVSSHGLRVILKASKRLAAMQGRFAVCGLQSRITTIFDVTAFDRIITVHANRDEGLANL